MYTKEIKLNQNEYFNEFSLFVNIEDEYFIFTSDSKENLYKFVNNIDKIKSYENDEGEEYFLLDDNIIEEFNLENITEQVILFEHYFKSSVIAKLKEFEILLNSIDGINTLIENRTRDIVIWVNSDEFLEYTNKNLENNEKIKTLDEAKDRGYEIEIVDNSVIEFVG